MWPFKWKLSACTFTWCYLFLKILENEIWNFGRNLPLATFGSERVNEESFTNGMRCRISNMTKYRFHHFNTPAPYLGTLNMATKPSSFRYSHLQTFKRISEPKNNVLDWTCTFVKRYIQSWWLTMLLPKTISIYLIKKNKAKGCFKEPAAVIFDNKRNGSFTVEENSHKPQN